MPAVDSYTTRRRESSLDSRRDPGLGGRREASSDVRGHHSPSRLYTDEYDNTGPSGMHNRSAPLGSKKTDSYRTTTTATESSYASRRTGQFDDKHKYSEHNSRYDSRSQDKNTYYRDGSIDGRSGVDSGLGSRHDSSVDSRWTDSRGVDNRRVDVRGDDHRSIDDRRNIDDRSNGSRKVDNRDIRSHDGRARVTTDNYDYHRKRINSQENRLVDGRGGARPVDSRDSNHRYNGTSHDKDDVPRGARRSASRSKVPFHDESESDDKHSRAPPTHPSSGVKKRKRKNITANLSGTRYDVIRSMVEQAGFSITRDEDNFSYLIWNDSFVATERISELKPYQKINHFPGMGEICRKDCLARNMAKMSRLLPDEFSFIPRTWILPSEYTSFQSYARDLKKKKKSKTFIVKPANGAMGNGISLYRNPEKIPQNEHIIVQEYIDKPFLVDGFKCDMRIYVLVTSCDPLRIFLYNDGLLRMGTEHYVHPSDHNIDQLFMHLTNYSVNKHSDTYQKSATIDSGSKRTLKFLNDYLRRHEYDVSFIWKNIVDMIVKTILVVHPHVLHAYRMCRPGAPPGGDSVCFEVLGFDFMLDRKMRPWLLEINRSPSFGTDERLDYDIKSGLLEDTLRLINIKASDKRKNLAAQKAETQKRLLRPHKRVDNETSELEKKRQNVEKKKEELKDMLTRIRKDSAREDYENRNCGRFKRIFPSEDRFRREHYAGLMSEVFGAFISGRTNTLQQEVKRVYTNQLREEDVLDMLAQCEADERDGKSMVTNRLPRGPKPLTGMPTLTREPEQSNSDEDEEDDDYSRPKLTSRPSSKGDKNKSRSGSSKNGGKNLDDVVVSAQISQREKELESTQRTLTALNDMRIKFPGKTDSEAEIILDKLHENWKFHKPRIASYWLVKLDSIKRRKVIDIVRSNVRAVLQRTWRLPDVENIKLFRVFSRVFNRLLWSHGQGLWNCFQNTGQADNAWETIFSKSSEPISGVELNCCRRIVQLCRDCLLIVYQFAAEAKNQSTGGSQSNLSADTDLLIRRSPGPNGLQHSPSATTTPRISSTTQLTKQRLPHHSTKINGVYARSASMGSLHTAS